MTKEITSYTRSNPVQPSSLASRVITHPVLSSVVAVRQNPTAQMSSSYSEGQSSIGHPAFSSANMPDTPAFPTPSSISSALPPKPPHFSPPPPGSASGPVVGVNDPVQQPAVSVEKQIDRFADYISIALQSGEWGALADDFASLKSRLTAAMKDDLDQVLQNVRQQASDFLALDDGGNAQLTVFVRGIERDGLIHTFLRHSCEPDTDQKEMYLSALGPIAGEEGQLVERLVYCLRDISTGQSIRRLDALDDYFEGVKKWLSQYEKTGGELIKGDVKRDMEALQDKVNTGIHAAKDGRDALSKATLPDMLSAVNSMTRASLFRPAGNEVLIPPSLGAAYSTLGKTADALRQVSDTDKDNMSVLRFDRERARDRLKGKKGLSLSTKKTQGLMDKEKEANDGLEMSVNNKINVRRLLQILQKLGDKVSERYVNALKECKTPPRQQTDVPLLSLLRTVLEESGFYDAALKANEQLPDARRMAAIENDVNMLTHALGERGKSLQREAEGDWNLACFSATNAWCVQEEHARKLNHDEQSNAQKQAESEEYQWNKECQGIARDNERLDILNNMRLKDEWLNEILEVTCEDSRDQTVRLITHDEQGEVNRHITRDEKTTESSRFVVRMPRKDLIRAIKNGEYAVNHEVARHIGFVNDKTNTVSHKISWKDAPNVDGRRLLKVTVTTENGQRRIDTRGIYPQGKSGLPVGPAFSDSNSVLKEQLKQHTYEPVIQSTNIHAAEHTPVLPLTAGNRTAVRQPPRPVAPRSVPKADTPATSVSMSVQPLQQPPRLAPVASVPQKNIFRQHEVSVHKPTASHGVAGHLSGVVKEPVLPQPTLISTQLTPVQPPRYGEPKPRPSSSNVALTVRESGPRSSVVEEKNVVVSTLFLGERPSVSSPMQKTPVQPPQAENQPPASWRAGAGTVHAPERRRKEAENKLLGLLKEVETAQPLTYPDLIARLRECVVPLGEGRLLKDMSPDIQEAFIQAFMELDKNAADKKAVVPVAGRIAPTEQAQQITLGQLRNALRGVWMNASQTLAPDDRWMFRLDAEQISQDYKDVQVWMAKRKREDSPTAPPSTAPRTGTPLQQPGIEATPSSSQGPALPEHLRWLRDGINDTNIYADNRFDILPHIIAQAAYFKDADALLVITNLEGVVLEVFDSRRDILMNDPHEFDMNAVINSERPLSVIQQNQNHYNAWLPRTGNMLFIQDRGRFCVDLQNSRLQTVAKDGLCMTSAAEAGLAAFKNRVSIYNLGQAVRNSVVNYLDKLSTGNPELMHDLDERMNTASSAVDDNPPAGPSSKISKRDNAAQKTEINIKELDWRKVRQQQQADLFDKMIAKYPGSYNSAKIATDAWCDPEFEKEIGEIGYSRNKFTEAIGYTRPIIRYYINKLGKLKNDKEINERERFDIPSLPAELSSKISKRDNDAQKTEKIIKEFDVRELKLQWKQQQQALFDKIIKQYPDHHNSAADAANARIALIRDIISEVDRPGDISMAATAWCRHRTSIARLGITQTLFAREYNVPSTTLNRYIGMHLPISELISKETRRQVKKIIKKTQCLRSECKAADTYIENEEIITSMGVSQNLFGRLCQVKKVTFSRMVSLRKMHPEHYKPYPQINFSRAELEVLRRGKIKYNPPKMIKNKYSGKLKSIVSDAVGFMIKIEKEKATIAAGIDFSGEVYISSSYAELNAAQKKWAKDNEINIIYGDGHAEEKLINNVPDIKYIETSRHICQKCEFLMRGKNIITTGEYSHRSSASMKSTRLDENDKVTKRLEFEKYHLLMKQKNENNLPKAANKDEVNYLEKLCKNAGENLPDLNRKLSAIATGVDLAGKYYISSNIMMSPTQKLWAQLNNIEIIGDKGKGHAEVKMIENVPGLRHIEVSRPICLHCEVEILKKGIATTTSFSNNVYESHRFYSGMLPSDTSDTDVYDTDTDIYYSSDDGTGTNLPDILSPVMGGNLLQPYEKEKERDDTQLPAPPVLTPFGFNVVESEKFTLQPGTSGTAPASVATSSRNIPEGNAPSLAKIEANIDQNRFAKQKNRRPEEADKAVEEMIQKAKCRGNVKMAATAWVDYCNQRQGQKRITQARFAELSFVNCKVLNTEIKKQEDPWSKLDEEQHRIAAEIIGRENCQGNLGKSVECWKKNKIELRSVDITMTHFARLCRVSEKTLPARVLQGINREQKYLDSQRLIAEITQTLCPRKISEVADAWVNNEPALLQLDVTKKFFAKTFYINETLFVSEIKKKKSSDKPCPSFIDDIINYYDCRGNIPRAKDCWMEKEQYLRDAGITLSEFARWCNVHYVNLSASITMHRPIEDQLSNSQLDVITKITQETNCTGDIGETAAAWICYKDELTNALISRPKFAKQCAVAYAGLTEELLRQETCKRRLTTDLHNLLKNIPCDKSGKRDKDKAAAAWISNEPILWANGVRAADFSRLCGVSQSDLSYAVNKLRPVGYGLNEVQIQLINQIIADESCKGDMPKATIAWEKNKKKLCDAGISANAFSRSCGFSGKAITKALGHCAIEYHTRATQ